MLKAVTITMAGLLFASTEIPAQGIRTNLRPEYIGGRCPPRTLCMAGPRLVNTNSSAILGQGGLKVATDGVPTIELEILKYRLRLGDEAYVPLYLAAAVPTLRATDVGDVLTSIIDPSGGIGSIAVGYEDFKWPKSWFKQHPKFGAHWDGLGSFKVTDAEELDGTDVDPAFIPVGNVRIHGRVLLPITQDEDEWDTSSLKGSLQLEVYSSYNWVGGDTYRALLGPTSSLETNLWLTNVVGAFVITDQINIEGGATLHINDTNIDKVVYFSFNIIR